MTHTTNLDALVTAQHGAVTNEQLRKQSVSQGEIRRWLRQGVIRRHHRGVYLFAGVPRSFLQMASAAALAVQPGGAVSHRTAANLWKFRTVDVDIDVVIRYPRRLTLSGTAVHRSRDLEPGDVTSVDGIATTTPERTIADLGLIFPDSEVRRILDHAVATGLVTVRDMRRLRRRIGKKGRNGAGTLHRVLMDIPEQAAEAESGTEVLFLRMCEQMGLPEPVLQLPVVVGGRSFRLDFAYPLSKVFIEIDGKAVHGEVTQIANDGGRQNLLVASGWTPIRFMYAHLVTSPDWCAAVVRDTLRSVDTDAA